MHSGRLRPGNVPFIIHYSSFIILLLLALLALAPRVRAAATSAQDPDIAVTPVVRLFPVTALGGESAPASFTITNSNATQTRTLGALSLSGPDASQFALDAAPCSGASLAANGGSCTVSVKFRPTSRGSKGAMLLIPSDAPDTPAIAAFVTNAEEAASEARRRMPPVLTSVSIPDTMAPGATYSLTWSLEGYHEDYTSYMVLFDCTGVASDCGANYGDASRFAESDNGHSVSVTAGNWQFSGVSDHRFNYSWSFKVPDRREDGTDWPAGGTDIVVRFYCKDDIDQERNRGSVSLMIPGNLAGEYYDTTGRRIVKRIVP